MKQWICTLGLTLTALLGSSFETHTHRIVVLAQPSTNAVALDQELRISEKRQIDALAPQIAQKIKDSSSDYLYHFSIPAFKSIQHAMEYRYLHSQIYYRLGMVEEAGQLEQATFEFLFPQLHKAIELRIQELFGESYLELCQALVRDYLHLNRYVTSISFRILPTHAIWRKIPSLERFQTMEKEEFATYLSDFIQIRWEMKLSEGEGRHSALINGVCLAPLRGIKSFRTLQLPQEWGYNGEPVVQLCYVIDGFPIELQLLGGSITDYLSSRDYADYLRQRAS